MQVIDGRIVVNDAVLAAELDEEAVLLNVDTGVYYGLDAVGNQIWKLFEAGESADEIVSRLLAEYEVDRETMASDVATFHQ